MEELSAQIGQHLPFVRRHARALTGSQATGDALAAAAIEAILEDRRVIDKELGVKLSLFRCFHRIWAGSGTPVASNETGLRGAAQRHLSALTPYSREALLLNALEGFTTRNISKILDKPEAEVSALLSTALSEIEQSIHGKVLIIEDEPIIAADIADIVLDLGHHVTGIARTHQEAVALGKSERPDLILADIQLADNSSGIAAVQELLSDMADLPVVFITAFPERLLTGERPEPAFLISKPYTNTQILSAVSQAMFFSSTETLKT